MIKKEKLIKYNKFRKLCLINSEDAIKTAEGLKNKSVNHIAFQLIVFGLEEIGKIFVGWYQINSKETWGKEYYKIPIDDHVKKLFWAIWGPSFSKEIVSKKQIEKFRNLASNLHNKRLDVMYTELTDTSPSSSKITDEELEKYLKLARSRLELAKIDGEVETQPIGDKADDLNWFMKATNQIEKRNFIFCSQSQEKLIEFSDVKPWISWLKKHFDDEEQEQQNLLKKELNKTRKEDGVDFSPKWKIKLKINSPSHSIRANVLNKFSSNNPHLNLSKGADSHTLIVELTLSKQTHLNELWNHGWKTSILFVAALNVGTNGFFYWNLPVNVDRFYEQIWDLENKKSLEAILKTNFQLDWSSMQMFLQEAELVLTFLVFRYFANIINDTDFEPVDNYISALGMLAKNDMHLRVEKECFYNFYLAFKKAIINNENLDTEFDLKDVGFRLLEKLIHDRTEFDKVMEIGLELERNKEEFSFPITLKEIIGIKQYAGLYFLTLAARKKYGDNSILLTQQEQENKKKVNS